MKYVYRAWKGDEQLFNLANDPAETTDLALLSSSQTTLLKWRARLVAQYVREGECSFMYRYILRESCSQFDSLPLTSLTGRTRRGVWLAER
jgi:hypothetical protein